MGRIVPTVLALFLALSTRASALSHPTREHAGLPAYVWYGLGHKLSTVPGVLYAGYEWWVRDSIFVVWSN